MNETLLPIKSAICARQTFYQLLQNKESFGKMYQEVERGRIWRRSPPALWPSMPLGTMPYSSLREIDQADLHCNESNRVQERSLEALCSLKLGKQINAIIHQYIVALLNGLREYCVRLDEVQTHLGPLAAVSREGEPDLQMHSIQNMLDTKTTCMVRMHWGHS